MTKNQPPSSMYCILCHRSSKKHLLLQVLATGCNKASEEVLNLASNLIRLACSGAPISSCVALLRITQMDWTKIVFFLVPVFLLLPLIYSTLLYLSA